MASLRRVKVLLVLNLIAVTGFVLFLAKCRPIALKSGDSYHEVHPRADVTNLTAHGVSPIQEAVLKRLSLLEDIVYRQLNVPLVALTKISKRVGVRGNSLQLNASKKGLSKSLGLIEGYGGRGKGGLPASLSPEEAKKAKGPHEKYGYNSFLSEKISLDRSIPDYRPTKCKELKYVKDLPQISLIFIFVNEALSVILRSVHSAVNHTPAHLLKEIILVDDNSDEEELKGPLEEYVHKRYPGLVKVVRNQKREGLIRARIEGWKAATGQITGFFDAHVEFTAGWAEPVLSRIQENPKRVILPSIDNIKQDSFEVQRYENSAHGYSWELWCMYINPPKDWWDAGDPSLPIRTPAMIGCSFVVNRKFFGDIGLLDPGMDVYGGENIELGIKVWLCGGSMEVLPCSRVAHIERKRKPYNNNIGFYTKRNALRVAEVWMDDYKSHVYIAWNLPLENTGIDIGDISERKSLRKKLKCKNFQWYLDHVYPEMRRYNSTMAYGELRNNKVKDMCLDQGPPENHTAIMYPCHGWGPQLARYTKEGYLHLGALGSTTFLPDTRCLVDNNKNHFPQLLDCEKVKSSLHKRWSFVQNGAVMNKGTGRCIEVELNSGVVLILRSCTGQRWTIKNFIK
uniref:Polypeptide N-acetylgalactosaminyltransferase n=1 Tax=Geotrypetes seraphini TaxID=260995 RepID=A0A6P8NLZ2_GEOSA|nr:polypeptide N-acetylgalactosaminyltransferase 17 isoform X1 [Geotrypetes seraphini]XP_033777108.1 polypeptide N-acetylgalactosaminyltransferase 17 isoform X1 [Geotrypetes seraphini]